MTGARESRTRLKDVAELAGVSIKTVSSVVHGTGSFSESTRLRVQAALEQLDYRPNISARKLRNGRSGIIALAFPGLDAPYFAELARNIIMASAAHGWTVLVDQTDGVSDRERTIVEGLGLDLIDGIIFSPLAMTEFEFAKRRDIAPIVLLGEAMCDGQADHVGIDNVAAAEDATNHLISLGRRRIAAIGRQPDPQPGTAHQRTTGYRNALAAAGMPYDEAFIPLTGSFRRASGARVMDELLALPEPPDAVFCFTDLLALGALRALLSRGVRVPEDVALIGYDDIEEGRYSTPTLTTIAPDKAQIAEAAVGLLNRRLNGGAGLPVEVIRTGYTLEVRESTVGRSSIP